MKKHSSITKQQLSSDTGQHKVTITIQPHPVIADHYYAYVHPLMSHPFILKSSRKQLDIYANQIFASSDKLVRAIDKIPQNINEIRGILTNHPEGLAIQGHLALSAIFGDELAGRMCSIDISRPSIFLISSDEFLIPWELLFRQSLIDNPNVRENNSIQQLVREFWAYHKMVGTIPFKTYEVDASNSTNRTRKYARKPKIAVICDPSLGFTNDEVEFFTAMQQTGTIELYLFDRWKLDEGQQAAEINIFLKERVYDIIHISCHAAFDPEKKRPYLSFRGLKYFRDNLDQRPRIELLGEPIIFLNTCNEKSAQGQTPEQYWAAEQTWGFVNELRDRGCQNVIALHSLIFDSIAKDMSIHFYSYLLRGYNLGVAMHNARTYIIEREASLKDLTALFYCAYCDPDIILELDSPPINLL